MRPPSARTATMTDDNATPQDDPAEDRQVDAEGGDQAMPRAGESPADAPGEGDQAAAGEPPAPSLEELLAAAQADTRATRDKMLRIAADFENFRKRAGRETEDARKRGTLEAVKDLLPVFDSLERATAHVEESAETAAIVEGLRLVHRQFIDVLGRMGIERIGALGQPFDPGLHESIQYLHSDEHAAGIVMAELQPGYRLGTTLLRPAMVVVSRGPAEQPVAAPPGEEASGAPATAEAGEDTAEAGEDTPEAGEDTPDAAEADEGSEEPAG